MSRAFVKELDGDAVGSDLPDRPISEHPNFVTARGLDLIEVALERARADLAAAQAADEKPALAAAARDVRYWTARHASAEVVAPSSSDEVRFGSKVTIEREDGRTQRFRITGEDEADPSNGTISYVAPLARALVGKKAGDEIAFMDDTILVRAVEV